MSSILKPLAYIATAAFSLLGVMSSRSQKARYYFNLSLYVGSLATCSILGVIYSLTMSLIGQRLNINYITARTFYNICHPLIGVRFEVEGEHYLQDVLVQKTRSTGPGGLGEAVVSREGDSLLGHEKIPRSAVLVGNHQSFFDILYLGRIFPKRATIMAKKELKWMPLLGWYMNLSGAVFVDRKNNKDAVKAMNIAGEEMKRKDVSLWIFPEGTRSMSAEPHLLPFKKGAFHLAVQAKVPIIPVVCENYHRLFDGKTRLDHGVLKIKVLPPISTEHLTSADVGDLAERVREQMLETLTEISAQRSPPPSAEGSATRTDEASSAPERVDLRKRSDAADEETTGRQSTSTPSSSSKKASAAAPSAETASTEDEMDEDGAILVARPSQAKATA